MYHGDAFFLEQRRHEIFVVFNFGAGSARLADYRFDTWINIKRALRFRALQAICLVQNAHYEITTLDKNSVVLGDEVLWPGEGLDTRPLHDRRWMRRLSRLQFAHHVDQRFGPCRISETPARHAIRFRETVHRQCAVVELRLPGRQRPRTTPPGHRG